MLIMFACCVLGCSVVALVQRSRLLPKWMQLQLNEGVVCNDDDDDVVVLCLGRSECLTNDLAWRAIFFSPSHS